MYIFASRDLLLPRMPEAYKEVVSPLLLCFKMSWPISKKLSKHVLSYNTVMYNGYNMQHKNPK